MPDARRSRHENHTGRSKEPPPPQRMDPTQEKVLISPLPRLDQRLAAARFARDEREESQQEVVRFKEMECFQ